MHLPHGTRDLHLVKRGVESRVGDGLVVGQHHPPGIPEILPHRAICRADSEQRGREKIGDGKAAGGRGREASGISGRHGGREDPADGIHRGEIEGEARAAVGVGYTGHGARLSAARAAAEAHRERYGAAVVAPVHIQREFTGRNGAACGRRSHREHRSRAVAHIQQLRLLTGGSTAVVGGTGENGDPGTRNGCGGHAALHENRRAGAAAQRHHGGPGRRSPKIRHAAVVRRIHPDTECSATGHRSIGRAEARERQLRRLIGQHGDAALGHRPFVPEAVDGDGAIHHRTAGRKRHAPLQHAGLGRAEHSEIRGEAHAHAGLRLVEHGFQGHGGAGDGRRIVLQPQFRNVRTDGVQRREGSDQRLPGERIARHVAHVVDGGREGGIGRKDDIRQECQDKAVHAKGGGARHGTRRTCQGNGRTGLDGFVEADSDRGGGIDLLAVVRGCQ